ncbi:MAG: DUF6429 family protein [Hadesarchaea archaeon]|nr:DUF6429 family protein [Hadesarchaea archaeon]
MKEIEDLTLLLIYLTSWDENPKREYGDKPRLRAWKGYDWGVLDALQEKGFIVFQRRQKSVFLTEKGVERAKELQRLLSKVVNASPAGG